MSGKFRYETKLQERVAQEVKKKYKTDVWFYHPREGKGGRKGILDCFMCFKGLFIVGELKCDLEINPPTPLQKYNMMCIRRAGGETFEADTVDDFMNALEIIAIRKGILR